jgi:hypothetical protein
MSIISILPMGHHITPLVNRQTHLTPILMHLPPLPLRNTGDLRLMQTVKLIRNIDSQQPCFRLSKNSLHSLASCLKFRTQLLNAFRSLQIFVPQQSLRPFKHLRNLLHHVLRIFSKFPRSNLLIS